MVDRRVELDYVFDRLGGFALAQAYRMLVPQELAAHVPRLPIELLGAGVIALAWSTCARLSRLAAT